jgi:hypothetical protein
MKLKLESLTESHNNLIIYKEKKLKFELFKS